MTSTWLADGWTVTWRNMLKFRRSPDYVVFAVLQPIMFVLLFSQVYGGSIRVDGTNYTDYLMAGIFGTKAYMTRLAGQAKSPAKAAAARANGAKGGRPRKAAHA